MLNAKEFLSRAYKIDQRINCKLEQVSSLRALAEKATAVLTVVPKGTAGKGMEDNIVDMLALETVVNEDLKQLIATKREIVTVIKCVEPTPLQTLLEMRYLNFMAWDDVADGMGLTLRSVFHQHGKALAVVEKIRRA